MSIDPLGALLDFGGKLIDRLIPDPKQKADAILKLQALQQSGDLAVIASQSEINKVEAASPRMFIAGWRPFIGWICACGLGMQFIVAPLFNWVAALLHQRVTFPPLDTSVLMTLLVGMLGLGGMRTVEKLSGAEGRHG